MNENSLIDLSLARGQLCVDRDTKDALPDGGRDRPAGDRLLGAADSRGGGGRVVERARLGVLPEDAAGAFEVQRGDDTSAPHAEERREREAVLRGGGCVEPAAVRADHRADLAGQIRRLLVQRALPRVRRAVHACKTALTRRPKNFKIPP